jgi:hypothetical protein
MSTVESKATGVQVNLNDEEASIFRESLAAYLGELRIETARTDDKDLRDHLWDRERVIERVLAQLVETD